MQQGGKSTWLFDPRQDMRELCPGWCVTQDDGIPDYSYYVILNDGLPSMPYIFYALHIMRSIMRYYAVLYTCLEIIQTVFTMELLWRCVYILLGGCSAGSAATLRSPTFVAILRTW